MKRRKRARASESKPLTLTRARGASGKFLQHRQFTRLIGSMSLPARQVRVWLALWDIEPGSCGEFFASGQHIANLTGLRREHASSAMKALVGRGLLVRVTRGRSEGFATVWKIPPTLPATSAAVGTTSLVPTPQKLVPSTAHQ